MLRARRAHSRVSVGGPCSLSLKRWLRVWDSGCRLLGFVSRPCYFLTVGPSARASVLLEGAQKNAPLCIFNSQLRRLYSYLHAEECTPSPLSLSLSVSPSLSVSDCNYFSQMLYIKGAQSTLPGPEYQHHLVKNTNAPPTPRPTESNSGAAPSNLDFSMPSKGF